MSSNLESKDIDATLKIGYTFGSGFWTRFFISMYIVLGVMFVMLLTMLIGIPLTVGEYDSGVLITIICGGSFSVLLLILLIFFHRHRQAMMKKVDVFLRDAVVLNAKAVSKGEKMLYRGIMVCRASAIEVEFEYNNQRYIRKSTYRENPLYSPVYMKYINKSILIAYSPKYDEVMFIKLQSFVNNNQ